MNIPTNMKDDIWAALNDARAAANAIADILNVPEGKRPDTLEAHLNVLQDAGFRARSAYKDWMVK